MEASFPHQSASAAELPVGSSLGYDPTKPIMTGKDLLESGLVGMWADREDITDNLAFARSLGRHPRTYE
jgi:hypothetical protein